MADIMKQGTGKEGKPNLPTTEWNMILTLPIYALDIKFPTKCWAPVLYSQDLYLFCKLHLEDGKGMYGRESESKKQL